MACSISALSRTVRVNTPKWSVEKPPVPATPPKRLTRP